jgi:hypothetical protein
MLQAAKLWARQSARGTDYLSGRLGGVKVVIMPNRDFAEGDPANSHTHILFFADGSPTQPSQQRPTAQPAPAEQRERPRRDSHREQIEDDPVPF